MNTLTRRCTAGLIAALTASCVSGGALFAFADQPVEETADQPAASVVQGGMVLDMNGDEAIEEGAAETVLTANSVATQMVLMLGGEEAAATLGQGFNYAEDSLNYAMFPDLGEVRTFTRDDATVENVAVVDPDLVVIDVQDTVDTLRDSDISAAYVAVNSPETIVQAVEIIGAALGGEAEEQAQDYVAFYTSALDEVSAVSADLADDEKPRVMHLGGTTSTSGSNSMPDSWITAAGGVNAAAEMGLDGSRVEINTETILEADPDVIICENQDTVDEIMGGEAYSELKAVQSGQVVAAPFGTAVWSMGTAETAVQLYWAASVINPELYADVDVDAVTRDFFERFYEYELSDEELDAIFHR